MDYTIYFYKSDMGVVGQILELPDVVSVGRNVAEARQMLKITLDERIGQYRSNSDLPTPEFSEKYIPPLSHDNSGD